MQSYFLKALASRLNSNEADTNNALPDLLPDFAVSRYSEIRQTINGAMNYFSLLCSTFNLCQVNEMPQLLKTRDHYTSNDISNDSLVLVYAF